MISRRTSAVPGRISLFLLLIWQGFYQGNCAGYVSNTTSFYQLPTRWREWSGISAWQSFVTAIRVFDCCVVSPLNIDLLITEPLQPRSGDILTSSLLVFSFGISLFLCGILSPIFRKIKQLELKNPATSLYLIIGLFFSVWGVLLHFMNKMGWFIIWYCFS